MVVSCMAFYWAFAYGLERTDLIKLLTLWTALFFLGYKLYTIKKYDFKFLMVVSILFRLVFILAIPNLSQDFYRFIWDGRMIVEGFNPYLYLPNDLMAQGTAPMAQAQELYNGMGELSAEHFTNYPPINQLCFVIAGLLSGKSILGAAVVMRTLIIFADIGTLYFGKKLLERLSLPAHLIFLYFLNPFIIIELTGNLHFEGVMVFFLVWSLYLLHKGKWWLSAIVLALSISVKLIPLLFLPLVFQYFVKRDGFLPQETKIKRFITLIGYYLIVGIVTVTLFLPFFSSAFINNYGETVGLWFGNFEFNGSLYYIAREIGYTFRGYNEIQIIGKIISLLVFLFVIAITFFRKNHDMAKLITAMLFAFSFYLFTATTVHPWYIATLLILSVFTKYRFPLVWSAVIILSYLAYGNAGDKENPWVIGLEYLVVYGYFIWEVFLKKPSLLKQRSLDHS